MKPLLMRIIVTALKGLKGVTTANGKDTDGNAVTFIYTNHGNYALRLTKLEN